jgi:uncharacterized protein YjbI with pentapeptide repeats
VVAAVVAVMVWWPWLVAGLVAGLVAVVVALGAWWLWWRLPKRQVDRLRLTIRDPKARADVEDNFRKTIGQLIGGAGLLIGAVIGALFAYVQFTAGQRNSELQFAAQQGASWKQFEEQQKASRDLLISNQVSKGFELLGQTGSDKLTVRLGGIYALEGVMNQSEQYHQPVLEALCAFVRDGTRTATGDGPPATDVQAALTVIGRRSAGTGRVNSSDVNLSHAHIPGAILREANLSSANLSNANLRFASLPGADLSLSDLRFASLAGAHLEFANLGRAFLSGTKLIAANLHNAILIGAHLDSADLTDANLTEAHLNNADLRSANLGDAFFIHADLSSADLTGAHLHSIWQRQDGEWVNGTLDAVLSGADLRGAKITQAQLDMACGTEARLDPGLKIKPCQK